MAFTLDDCWRNRELAKLLREKKKHHIDAVSISETQTIASRLMVSLSDIKYERIISLQFKPVRIFLPERKMMVERMVSTKRAEAKKNKKVKLSGSKERTI